MHMVVQCSMHAGLMCGSEIDPALDQFPPSNIPCGKVQSEIDSTCGKYYGIIVDDVLHCGNHFTKLILAQTTSKTNT